MDLCDRAQWFDRTILLDHPAVLDSYVTDGWLPGDVCKEDFHKWCWCNQFAVEDRDLIVRHDETRLLVRADFGTRAQLQYEWRRTMSVQATPTSMFFYRTSREHAFLSNRNAISVETISGWRGA